MFYKKLCIKILVLLICTLSSLFSKSDIDGILSQYNKENALSQQTIDENKGHLVLFTRDDLEKMRANSLKDVFKSTPFVYYHEDRYAMPDPFTSGGLEPYRSSFIRVYIDGVEVTQGWIGSGLVLYGNINIDFADHIEFYYMTPSFESSTEPAYITIFIYSKDASRDDGATINLSQGSRGTNRQTFTYGDKTDEFSYMLSFAHTDATRAKIDNGTSKSLSRDYEDTQLFAYIKDDTQTFHLQLLKKNSDSLAGASWDATPTRAGLDFLNVHLDYSKEFGDFWKLVLSYDWLRTDFDLEDDKPLMYTMANNSSSLIGNTITYNTTAELTYTRVFDKHHFVSGVKARYKKMSKFDITAQDIDMPSFNSESVLSIFAQEQYLLTNKQILSASLSYNHINRNGGVAGDDLWQYRIGYSYNDTTYGYKAYIYRNQFVYEPMTRLNILKTGRYDIKPQTTYGVTQEFDYTEDNYKSRFILMYLVDKDSCFRDDLSSNSDKDTRYFISYFDYEYEFDYDNKFMFEIYYTNYQNMYNYERLEDISGYFKFFNRYDKINFYNEFVWHTDSSSWEKFIDWTAVISWDITPSLSISLKGENILNRAKELSIKTFDITTTPIEPLGDIKVPSIDRVFSINVEYMF